MSIVLTPLQNKYIYSKAKVTAFCAARACGKTFATAYLICNRMTHGRSVLAVAPTYPLLNAVLIKDTLDMFRRHKWKYDYNKSEKLLIIYDRHGIELSRCYFRSADCYDTIRGISNMSVLVMDEAAYCDREAYEVSLACLRGESVRNPQVFLVSTPKGRANWFSEVYLDETSASIHGTSLDNPYIDPNYIKMLESQYGSDEFARQEIYAEIIDGTSSSVFKSLDVSMLLTESQYVRGDVVFGVDVGGEGDDYSVIAVLNGNRYIDIRKRKTPKDEDLVNFYNEMHRLYNPKRAVIDRTGVGQHAPSRLAQLYKGTEFIGLHFSAKKAEGYANVRAEIYFSLRDKITKNNYHLDNAIDERIRKELEVELYATEYSMDNHRDFILKKKSEIKKVISRSPDVCDAVALACYNGCSISVEQTDAVRRNLKQSIRPANNRRN